MSRGRNVQHGQARPVKSVFWPVLGGVLVAAAITLVFAPGILVA